MIKKPRRVLLVHSCNKVNNTTATTLHRKKFESLSNLCLNHPGYDVIASWSNAQRIRMNLSLALVKERHRDSCLRDALRARISRHQINGTDSAPKSLPAYASSNW